jgi:hypothetical protein
MSISTSDRGAEQQIKALPPAGRWSAEGASQLITWMAGQIKKSTDLGNGDVLKIEPDYG